MTTSAPSTVDYTSATQENGLTRAFCKKTAAATFDIAPPVDLAGNAMTGVFDVVEVVLDYSHVGSDGTRTEVKPTAAQFPTAYQKAVTSDYGTDSRQVWDRTVKTLTFSWGAQDLTAATPQIVIPAALLLGKIGTTTVSYISVEGQF